MSAQRPSRGAEVAAFFDAFAAEYDRAYGRTTVGGRILRQRLEAVLDLLGRGPGQVLDAGMGAGVLCERLERVGWTVSGVDISPVMVDAARQRLPEVADQLVIGSVLDLPYADAAFDAAVCTGVLEYVEESLGQAIFELARVLRPGGVVVVSLPNYGSLHGTWRFRVFYPVVRHAKLLLRKPPPPSREIVTLGQLQEALAAAGLTVTAVETLGMRSLPSVLGRRLERSRSRQARVFGTQFVVRAVKGSR